MYENSNPPSAANLRHPTHLMDSLTLVCWMSTDFLCRGEANRGKVKTEGKKTTPLMMMIFYFNGVDSKHLLKVKHRNVPIEPLALQFNDTHLNLTESPIFTMLKWYKVREISRDSGTFIIHNVLCVIRMARYVSQWTLFISVCQLLLFENGEHLLSLPSITPVNKTIQRIIMARSLFPSPVRMWVCGLYDWINLFEI